MLAFNNGYCRPGKLQTRKAIPLSDNPALKPKPMGGMGSVRNRKPRKKVTVTPGYAAAKQQRLEAEARGDYSLTKYKQEAELALSARMVQDYEYREQLRFLEEMERRGFKVR